MDPLSQLKDIHLPEPVSIWPPAPGWWLLAAAALIITLFSVIRITSWYRKNAYRRLAEVQLDALDKSYKQHEDCIIYACDINRLLKQVAVTYYDRECVSRLSGKQWLEFLDRTGNTRNFTEGAGQLLESAQYRKTGSFEVAGLGRCCRQWLKEHA